MRKRLHGYIRRAAERALEIRHGVDSSGFVYLDDFGLDDAQRVWHDPSEWLGLRRSLKRLEIRDTDVFVDLGAGKGRAVLVAALEFPFQRVIGVEIAEDLTAIARTNIERNADRLRCRKVELITADALEYQLPDDVTVVYLYSPFVGETFQKALERLLGWVDASGRAVRLVYNYPFEHNRVMASGRATVIDVQSALWPLRDRSGPEVIVTYSIAPLGADALEDRLLEAAARRVSGAEQWLGAYDPGFVIERPGRRIASPEAE